MSNSIEMRDLSSSRPGDTSPDPNRQQSDAGIGQRVNTTDGAVSVWAWTSAVVFALFSTCLLAFPRLLVKSSEGRGSLTPLEKYLSFHLGIIFGTLAITIIALLPNEWPTGLHSTTDPNSHPLLIPVTASSLAIAMLCYDNSSVGTLSTIALLGSAAVGLFGLWVLVFSGPPAISTKTGADKHTSSFIFGNKNAASVRKTLWKRNQSK